MRYCPAVDAKELRDRVGLDYVECEGCDLTWPLEETVRMLRFRGQMGRYRVCKFCAGVLPNNPYVILGMRLAQGQITEHDYYEALEALDSERSDRR